MLISLLERRCPLPNRHGSGTVFVTIRGNGMTLFSDDVYSSVFKRSFKDDIGEVALNGRMLKVFLELDGEKDIDRLSQVLPMDIDSLKEIITKLHKLHLVEKVMSAPSVLNDDFLDFLKKQLSLAMGPIAEFLVEDEVLEFSSNTNEIPFDNAPELVDLLARQIRREEKRIAFQQVMVKKLADMAH